MPRNAKCFIRGTVIEVCFRTEEGLPLVCTPYMKKLVTSYLATAQSYYPVEICHFIVMSNHVHMILVVQHPDNVPLFMGYFKRETAHAINRLLGRKKRTVWCEGYDSPTVLDSQKTLERIAYIYTNPQSANLVDMIEEYPNLSSWNALLNDGEMTRCKRIPRYAVSELPKGKMSFQQQEILADRMEELGEDEHTLVITPNAWLKCFLETINLSPETIREDIVALVKVKEAYLRASRVNKVIGTLRLRLEEMTKPHQPKKRGERMICLSSFAESRETFISWYKTWSAPLDSKSQIIPGGMFAAGCFLFANVLPYTVPIVCAVFSGSSTLAI